MKKAQKNENEQVRIHYTLPIIIKGKNIEDRAYSEKTVAENVTRRGVFFCTEQRLQPGSTVRVYPVDDPTHSVAKVEVVWLRKDNPGVGTKLVGSNRNWMKFLLNNSISVVDDPATEE